MHIDRRFLLKGATALPLATVLADPAISRAVAATLPTVRTTTASGKSVSGVVAMPAKTPAPAVVLIHEWWGLNDQIKAMADAFAKEGYVAIAVDLYDGKVATSPQDARSYMQGVNGGEATETLQAWVKFLREHKDVNGKVGTVGWCFGGAWSLNASIATPVDATVVYYGRVTPPADKLAKLQGPVLGHFATKDKFINKKMVDGFVAEMKKAGKPLDYHWYEADHAFANPTGGRYDEAAAKTSWQRTLEFLKANM